MLAARMKSYISYVFVSKANRPKIKKKNANRLSNRPLPAACVSHIYFRLQTSLWRTAQCPGGGMPSSSPAAMGAAPPS
jgi:hypothetical protein